MTRSAFHPTGGFAPEEAVMRLKTWGIIAALLAALVAAAACSSDSPTPTQPTGGGTGGGTTGSGGVTLTLVASNTKPKAGSCTLVQGSVLFNGQPVPDGTSVVFSTDFGFFGDSGLNIVSLLTQQSAALATLCSDNEGTANVTARVTYQNKTGQGAIAVTFGAGVTSGPFISFCTPSIGPAEGGTAVTITGGNFDLSGTASLQVTVVFSSKDGTIQLPATVTGNSATAISVLTPAYPKPASSPIPVDVTVRLKAGVVSANVTASSCFTYFGSNVSPQIFSLLPSSGPNTGGTRVTILGSGFQAPVQVFFGDAPNQTEAVVVSVAFDQIVILTPAAFGAGQGNQNQSVSVTVKNAGAGVGLQTTLTNAFRYVTKMLITGVSPTSGPPGTLFTIYGQGFQGPLAVAAGTTALQVISVSATEVVVTIPLGVCVTGPISMTNLTTGDSATSSILISDAATVTNVTPSSGPATGGTLVTITGINLFSPSDPSATTVTVGDQAIAGLSFSGNGGFQTISFTTPANSTPLTSCSQLTTIRIVNGSTGCSVDSSTGFSYKASDAGSIDFSSTPGSTGSMQVTIDLTGQGSVTGAPPTQATIDFGDSQTANVTLSVSGSTSSGSVTHTYAASGNYNVSITSFTNNCPGVTAGVGPTHQVTAP
jgi:IPT/TIG domain